MVNENADNVSDTEDLSQSVVAWSDPQNDEDSLLDPTEARSLVTYSADWTVETIISQLKQGRININPSFQRRDAWLNRRKSAYIESLILGLPVPQLVLAEDSQKRGHFIVLDGKQRLLSMMKFSGLYPEPNSGLVLEGLTIRTDLNGQTLAAMETNIIYQEDLAIFLNPTIRTVVVRNWKTKNILHGIFHRLNTGSVQLSPQELRQALFPGKFTTFLDQSAASSLGTQKLLKIDKPDYRMRDVELLLRFISFYYFRPRYNGDLKGFMDATCDVFNKDWDNCQESIISTVRLYEDWLSILFECFEDRPGRKLMSFIYIRKVLLISKDVETLQRSALQHKERTSTRSLPR